MESSLHLSLQKSKTLNYLRYAIFGLAALGVLLTGLSDNVKLLFIVVLFIYAVVYFKDCQQYSIQELIVENNNWFIVISGKKIGVTFFSQQILLPFFVFIHFLDVESGRRHYLPLFNDAIKVDSDEKGAIERDPLRRLRVLLRFGMK